MHRSKFGQSTQTLDVVFERFPILFVEFEVLEVDGVVLEALQNLKHIVDEFHLVVENLLLFNIVNSDKVRMIANLLIFQILINVHVSL